MITPVLSYQIFGFVVAIAAGFLLGALYDVLRIWRDFFHSRQRAVFFQDFFYMILCAFFSFLLALPLGSGAVRVYLLAGEAVGWFVYYFTIGQVTAIIFRAVSNFLYRHFFNPVGELFRRIVKWFGKKAARVIKFLKKKASGLKKCLKHKAEIVYNRHNGWGRKRRKHKVVRKYEGARKPKT